MVVKGLWPEHSIQMWHLWNRNENVVEKRQKCYSTDFVRQAFCNAISHFMVWTFHKYVWFITPEQHYPFCRKPYPIFSRGSDKYSFFSARSIPDPVFFSSVRIRIQSILTRIRIDCWDGGWGVLHHLYEIFQRWFFGQIVWNTNN